MRVRVERLIWGLWVILRASRRVRARQGFTRFFHHSSLGLPVRRKTEAPLPKYRRQIYTYG